MKKITLLLCIVMIICALLQPCAFAEAQNCTLTLSYSKNNVAFSDMEINIYRVADLNFEKTATFSSSNSLSANSSEVIPVLSMDGKA